MKQSEISKILCLNYVGCSTTMVFNMRIVRWLNHSEILMVNCFIEKVRKALIGLWVWKKSGSKHFKI